MSSRTEPVGVVAWYDYHCPYSYRATTWLDGLAERGLVRVTWRCFPLEQVNRDVAATEWRLWEQPLDYEQYRGRQDRRPLAAFLITLLAEELAEETGDEAAMRRLRASIYAARHEDRRDISEVARLLDVASSAGLDRGVLEARLTDDAVVGRARGRLADDWAAARAPWAIFGVPTMSLDSGRPFYLRLARAPGADEGLRLLGWLLDDRRDHPEVLELKLPEPSTTA